MFFKQGLLLAKSGEFDPSCCKMSRIAALLVVHSPLLLSSLLLSSIADTTATPTESSTEHSLYYSVDGTTFLSPGTCFAAAVLLRNVQIQLPSDKAFYPGPSLGLVQAWRPVSFESSEVLRRRYRLVAESHAVPSSGILSVPLPFRESDCLGLQISNPNGIKNQSRPLLGEVRDFSTDLVNHRLVNKVSGSPCEAADEFRGVWCEGKLVLHPWHTAMHARDSDSRNEDFAGFGADEITVSNDESNLLPLEHYLASNSSVTSSSGRTEPLERISFANPVDVRCALRVGVNAEVKAPERADSIETAEVLPEPTLEKQKKESEPMSLYILMLDGISRLGMELFGQDLLSYLREDEKFVEFPYAHTVHTGNTMPNLFPALYGGTLESCTYEWHFNSSDTVSLSPGSAKAIQSPEVETKNEDIQTAQELVDRCCVDCSDGNSTRLYSLRHLPQYLRKKFGYKTAFSTDITWKDTAQFSVDVRTPENGAMGQNSAHWDKMLGRKDDPGRETASDSINSRREKHNYHRWIRFNEEFLESGSAKLLFTRLYFAFFGRHRDLKRRSHAIRDHILKIRTRLNPNTVVFIAGDHGDAMVGEGCDHRKPFLGVLLPKGSPTRLVDALRSNANQLVTPWDLFVTWRHVPELFKRETSDLKERLWPSLRSVDKLALMPLQTTRLPGETRPIKPPAENLLVRDDARVTDGSMSLDRLQPISLFATRAVKNPERICQAAGVPEAICEFPPSKVHTPLLEANNRKTSLPVVLFCDKYSRLSHGTKSALLIGHGFTNFGEEDGDISSLLLSVALKHAGGTQDVKLAKDELCTFLKKHVQETQLEPANLPHVVLEAEQKRLLASNTYPQDTLRTPLQGLPAYGTQQPYSPLDVCGIHRLHSLEKVVFTSLQSSEYEKTDSDDRTIWFQLAMHFRSSTYNSINFRRGKQLEPVAVRSYSGGSRMRIDVQSYSIVELKKRGVQEQTRYRKYKSCTPAYGFAFWCTCLWNVTCGAECMGARTAREHLLQRAVART